LGTNSPVGSSYGTGTGITNPLVFTPTVNLSWNTIYVVAFNITGIVGAVATVQSLTGAGCEWVEYANVDYSLSIGLPTKRLQVFIGRKDSSIGYNVPYSDDPRLIATFDLAPTTCRYAVDAIFNTSEAESSFPLAQTATAIATATATISTTLGAVPTTNNMQYSVVARSGGTVPVAGAGNTLLSQGLTPALASQVAVSRQTNTQTWTTNADSAMVTFDFTFPSNYEGGIQGEAGKVVTFLV
jgi:hypothetical protein